MSLKYVGRGLVSGVDGAEGTRSGCDSGRGTVAYVRLDVPAAAATRTSDCRRGDCIRWIETADMFCSFGVAVPGWIVSGLQSRFGDG